MDKTKSFLKNKLPILTLTFAIIDESFDQKAIFKFLCSAIVRDPNFFI